MCNSTVCYMLTARRGRFSIASLVCLMGTVLAAYAWNRSYVEGRIIRENWPEFTPGDGWGPTNEKVAKELQAGISLGQIASLDEGRSLHYVFELSRSHPEALTGWNWYFQFSKNNIFFIRCIAGSLRLSVHTIERSYQEFEDAQSARFRTNRRPKSFEFWGFGVGQTDHQRIASYVEEDSWKLARRRYAQNEWRIMNANFRVSFLKLPIWIILGAFLIVPVRAFVVMPIRHHRRRRANRCVHCNYNLNALTEPRCPECGTPVPSRTPLV